MPLIGQVDQVRLLGPHGIAGPPLHLHRSKARPGVLSPFPHQEWHQLKSGTWVPVPELWGGAGFSGSWQWHRTYIGEYNPSTSTQTTQALSNAYTYNSAGNVGGGRVRFISAKTINNLYYFITAYTGTAANVTTVNVELRNDTANKPGSTQHINATNNPASATGWINVSGLSFAASADTSYWVSIADADGNGTDFATILLRMTAGVNPGEHLSGDRMAADSTNGWSTTTLRSAALSMCVTMSDGTTLGHPFTAVANSSSSTNRRGLLLSGLTETLKVLGMVSGSNTSNNLSGVELWSGSLGPSGTADATGTHDLYANGASTVMGYFFGTPQTLAKATQYRLVFTYSGAHTGPRKVSIGTGADANLKAAMQGGGTWYWTEANATTDWSNDDTTAWPQVAVVIEDQIAVASSGGLKQPPGLTGGLNG
jgi:hypothetical protein